MLGMNKATESFIEQAGKRMDAMFNHIDEQIEVITKNQVQQEVWLKAIAKKVGCDVSSIEKSLKK